MNDRARGMSEALLDDRLRGVPPGTPPFPPGDIAAHHWHPADGSMTLPVLTLNEDDFAHNCAEMFAYARGQGVAIAPHAKTPMAPRLARALLDRGAWGLSVANLQQASVLLQAGVPRLILANEIGGAHAGRHLGTLLAAHPGAELYAFADSPEAVASLAAAARHAGRTLKVLVEVGRGRGGARGMAGVERIIAALREAPGALVAGGVATYEGAAAVADAAATRAAIADLTGLAAEAFAAVRAVEPDRALVLTAGGSSFFDLVVAPLAPVVLQDGHATLVLRSGAIFFHDHGVYDRALRALDARGGFVVDGAVRSAADSFRPTLRLWGEILSRPQADLAIVGFGLRDVSADQDLPTPLRAWRDGTALAPFAPDAAPRFLRLNDQHAFLAVPPGSTLAVGDVIEAGISHPCTCLDRWRVLYGLDGAGRVRSAYRTYFG